MQQATSLFIIFTGLIELSLLLNLYPYYRKENKVKPNIFWGVSLFLSSIGYILLGSALFNNDDINHGISFLNTIANTLNFASFASLGLFCRAQNRTLSPSLIKLFILLIIIFAIMYEMIRIDGDFSQRNILIGTSTLLFFCWQIGELLKAKKMNHSHQFNMFFYCTLIEALALILRVYYINIFATSSSMSLNDFPLGVHMIAWTQFTFNILAYNSIAAYWAEKISVSNTKIEMENIQIKGLLQERDELIESLTIAEKTAQSGALSASFAHELNQPLGAIKINAQHLALLSQNEKNPKKLSLLEAIAKDSDRAASIIQSLKQIFSTSNPNKTSIDINQLIRRLGQFFENRSTKENFMIDFDLKAKHKVFINESEIQQAMINLLNNAIDAVERSSKKHKKIFISTLQENGYTFISVTDNGEGIDPSIQHHMFDLLKTNRQQGMGLGLWLTRYIIERHGGTLSFESTNGLGTTFIIKLK